MIGKILSAAKYVRGKEKIINFDKEAIKVSRELVKHFATCTEEDKFIRDSIMYLRKIVRHNEFIRKSYNSTK